MLFLVAGILIFIYIYKDLKFSKIQNAVSTLHYEWIVLSGVFGLLSHFIRALRWNLLIEPLSHRPRVYNTYLSVLVLYLFNILIPRGGEVARCSVITRYEKIPFTKLLGTVVSERLADLVTFLLIVGVLLAWDMSYFRRLINNNQHLSWDIGAVGTGGLIAVGIMAIVIVALVVIFKRSSSGSKFRSVVFKLLGQFREGVQTIRGSRNKWLFILYTFLIIFLWLMMLYVVFFAYEPTSHLTFSTAVITFAISSFAFLLPIQAGLGAWHFIVIQCLFLFGVDMDHGAVFALVAHTFTNLVFLAAGTLAFMLLPVVNQRRVKKLSFKEMAAREEETPQTPWPAEESDHSNKTID